MPTITNNKVASLEPRWAPFAGFSLLFDNPGNSLVVEGGISRISAAPTPNGALGLYTGLAKAIEDLDRECLRETYLFCPLPANSYHVTVWDGVNADNISSLNPAVYSDWSQFLSGLERSLMTPPVSMSVVAHANLRKWIGNITFRFDKLTLWGNKVLVARLIPADEASNNSLQALLTCRGSLSEAAQREIGIKISETYSPHISLGYFANAEYANAANTYVEEWTKQVKAKLTQVSISFTTLDIYGFTDMANFFKVTES